MKSKRNAVLEGAKAAADLHRELKLRNHVQSHRSSIDVFGIIVQRRIPLLFRPLDGLLGAYLPEPGIIVTTQRPLSIQRWTGAHELGHAVMHHRVSLDDESMLNRLASRLPHYEPTEIAADSFATHFLLPKWLFALQAERHGWSRKDLVDPVIVYQMGLRAGASYRATCMALARHNLVAENTLTSLLQVELKTLKRQLLAGYELENWHPDVWLLTEADEGTVIEGDSSDAFIMRLREHSGSGYLWDIGDLRAGGFVVFRDQRNDNGSELEMGGAGERELGARPGDSRLGRIDLRQVRPWQENGEPISRLSFTFDLRGKERGRPRAERRSLVAA